MKRLTQDKSGLSAREYALLAKLSSPVKVQNFLDTLPMNWEKRGDTHFSPHRVLQENKAHCIEGALLAAAALWIAGEPPLLMDLTARSRKGDYDHVVALYKRGGYFGAISKTNHATIRFRDPIYRSPRELALSYFHEWFLNSTGEKTLESYSKPLDMRRFGTKWLTAADDLWEVDGALNAQPHYSMVPKGNWRFVRRADAMELAAGRLIEWKKSDSRT